MSSLLSSITVGNLVLNTKDAAEDQLGELKIESLRALYVAIGGKQDLAKDFGQHHRVAHRRIIRACLVILDDQKFVVYDAPTKSHYFVHVPEADGDEAGPTVVPAFVERLAPVGQAEEQREQFRRLAAATHHHEAAIEAARTRLRDLDIERERLTALVGSDGTADSPKDMGAVDTVQRPGMGAVDTVQRPGMAQPFRQPVIPPTVSSSAFIQPDGRTFEALVPVTTAQAWANNL